MERGGGSVTALVKTNAEGQSTLNRDIGKVLCLLIDFLCLGKMSNAEKTDQKLALCHFQWTHFNGPRVMSYEQKSYTQLVLFILKWPNKHL